MTTNLPRREGRIEGSYTFISTDDLASQFVDIYLDMRQLSEKSTYHLYLSFDFLDSNASKILFRFLKILKSCSVKPGFPELKITYLYDWQDEYIEEFGLLLAEEFAGSLNLKQVDASAA